MSEQVNLQQPVSQPVPPKYAPAPVPQTPPVPIPPTVPQSIIGDSYEDIYGRPSTQPPVPPKYAPAPVPQTPPEPIPPTVPQSIIGDSYEDIYGRPSTQPPVPPKYAPAPVPQSIIGDSYEDIYGRPSTQPPVPPKYAPAPVPQTPPEPIPPTVPQSLIGDSYEDIIPGSSINTDELMHTRHFIEDVDSLIDDFDKFYNNSHYVTGGFGSAISYTSENCKKSIESLKKFAENNFLLAMNNVGEYESNLNKMKSIAEPIVGDFSSIHFNDDGSVVFPSGSSTNENQQTIATVENLYKRNKKIKQQIESLSNEKIV